MTNKNDDYTTIRVHRKTHEKLLKLGKFGENMDDVVNRLTQKEG